MGRFLDVDRWPHRDHFHHFLGFARPFYSMCADVDVTAAWTAARHPAAPSFFIMSLYAATRAAQAVEAMRLRVRDGRPWLHDRVAVSTTVGRADETFGYARIEPVDALGAFAAHAQQVIDTVAAGHGLAEPNRDDDVVFHSSLPWLRFTGFTNAMGGDDSIPRVVFGKCVPDGSRIVMPVALEVHHAVVHGRDAARFYERFENEIAGLS